MYYFIIQYFEARTMPVSYTHLVAEPAQHRCVKPTLPHVVVAYCATRGRLEYTKYTLRTVIELVRVPRVVFWA